MIDHLSPGANNFLLIVIAWCMLAWLGRLCKNMIMIMELSNGFNHDQVVRVDGIPLHSDFSALEVLSRGRFLHFLRSCRPAPMAMEVQTIATPVQVHRGTLKTSQIEPPPDEGRPWGVGLKFNSTVTCSVSMYWGVHASAVVSKGSRVSPDEGGGTGTSEARKETDRRGIFSLTQLRSRLAGRKQCLPPSSTVNNCDTMQPRDEETGLAATEMITLNSHYFEPGTFVSCSHQGVFGTGDNEILGSQKTSPPTAGIIPLQHDANPDVFPLVVVFHKFGGGEGRGQQQDHQQEQRSRMTSVLLLVTFDTSHPIIPPATILKHICITPDNQYLKQDIYGIDNPEEPDCVVCLSEPKDTILLPCRHLSVCSSCFPHLDKCPVCRAGFVSYLRFNSTQDGEQGAAEAEAQTGEHTL